MTGTGVLTYLRAALARNEGCCQEAWAYPAQPPEEVIVGVKSG